MIRQSVLCKDVIASNFITNSFIEISDNFLGPIFFSANLISRVSVFLLSSFAQFSVYFAKILCVERRFFLEKGKIPLQKEKI